MKETTATSVKINLQNRTFFTIMGKKIKAVQGNNHRGRRQDGYHALSDDDKRPSKASARKGNARSKKRNNKSSSSSASDLALRASITEGMLSLASLLS
jgi:hypothetical protein